MVPLNLLHVIFYLRFLIFYFNVSVLTCIMHLFQSQSVIARMTCILCAPYRKRFAIQKRLRAFATAF
jgi:hypothetical protein